MLRYYGNKRKLAEWITSFIPAGTDRLIEPFFGSGAVSFYAVKHGLVKSVVAMDLNSQLVNFWAHIKNRKCHTALGDMFNTMARKHEEDPLGYFQKIRAEEPSSLSAINQASRFYYLNQTSFNGLYRTNKKGEYNTPFGKRMRFTPLHNHEMYKYSQLMASIQIINTPYTSVEAFVDKNDWVYIDPPYYSESVVSRVDYGCPVMDFDRLHTELNNLNNLGVKVAVSHVENPSVDLILQPLEYKHRFDHNYTSSSDVKSRRPVVEVLHCNYTL